MGRSIPTVEVGSAGQGERAELGSLPEKVGGIRLDSLAWEEWLARPATSSFAYPLFDRAAGWIRGYMTVRKERRARGGAYWVAYRRSGGQLRKIYLGRNSQVTGQRLAAVAAEFLLASVDTARPSPRERG
jgi:LuxR family maltose regulon positive regulatory protein